MKRRQRKSQRHKAFKLRLRRRRGGADMIEFGKGKNRREHASPAKGVK